jgi:hypothetical protein
MGRPEILRAKARERIARGDAVTAAELDNDRRLEAEGCIVIRSGSLRHVIDLRAGLDDGQQRR